MSELKWPLGKSIIVSSKKNALYISLFALVFSACGDQKVTATTTLGTLNSVDIPTATGLISTSISRTTESPRSTRILPSSSPYGKMPSPTSTMGLEIATATIPALPVNPTVSVSVNSSPSALTTGQIVQLFRHNNGQGPVTPGQKVDPESYFNPRGVATDSKGYIYVADTQNNQIKKLSPKYGLLAVWGREGTGYMDHPLKIKLNGPMGLVIDKNDALYLIDKGTQRILKLDTEGNLLTSWGQDAQSSGNLPTTNWSGLALDNQNNLYVADQFHCDILKFSERGPSTLQSGSGNCGGEKGSTSDVYQIMLPDGVAVDGQGNYYVVGMSSPQITKLDRHGRLVKQMGNGPGQGDGQILFPSAITLDVQGNIYLCDSGNHRIEKFTPDGHFLLWWSVESSGAGPKARPNAILVDHQGNVYVTTEDDSGLIIYAQH